MNHRRAWPGTLLAAVGVLAAVALAFGVGRFPVALADVLRVLAAASTGGDAGVPDAVRSVVLQIRGPRIAAALAIGAALALAGACFQGLFRNPLVSPDILGASAGSALGAVLGIFLSLPIVGIQAAAFAGGLLAVGAVVMVGHRVQAGGSGDPMLVLLLTGLVVGALVGAGIGLVKVLADPYDQLPAMTFWLLGSLSGTGAKDLGPLLAPVVVGAGVLVALRHRLDAMSLPEEEARALGLPTTALRLALIAAATLVTAASVAVAGIVGWIGLVVPHLARFLVGPSFPRLLPVAALIGGGFLLLVDTLARTLAAVEVPLGILTAVVGTPFFIALLGRARRGWA
jgi:iron complex transport system permease protein